MVSVLVLSAVGLRFEPRSGPTKDYSISICCFSAEHIGFQLVKLKSSLRKVYGRHHILVNRYGTFVPQMTTDMSHLS
jgi:hypothetical protein